MAVYTVDQKCIMQVRAGGIAGRAYRADDRTLSDVLAGFYITLMQVQVLGYIGGTVRDKNVVAVGGTVAGTYYAPVTGGKYRGAGWCHVIGAAMGNNFLMNRMAAAQV